MAVTLAVSKSAVGAPVADDLATWQQEITNTAGSSGTHDYWSVEDARAREQLPLYETIPAARPDELTPANGYPKRATFLTWQRSHGDNSGARYSALDQINRQNVTNLQIAWVYHSRDSEKNLQCNPIIVGDVMFAPTAGNRLVAVNAVTGVEIWRFAPEGRPAYRGLIYWPGEGKAADRVLFCAGKYLYALDTKAGHPIASFGDGGKTEMPGAAEGDFGASTAAPAIFRHIIIVPGFQKDVWGFDVVNGALLWTFHTVPHPGEFGYDTWDHTESYAANDWSGTALDEVRGIAYIITGGAKPNFIGVGHLGQNLFANCLIALDARTGKRLWHFQEVRHDIWDQDITSPPNLTTITHNGKRVDVVVTCTKLGNTILLDRVSGKPLFSYRLRRAPASTLPGEITAPYQPDPELPEPFSKFEFTAADLFSRNEMQDTYVNNQFKSAVTGWFVPPAEGKTILYFGMDGGAEWSGACVDPETGHLYVSANHIGWFISLYRDEDPPEDSSAPKTRGRVVYETYCAACHGQTKLGMGTAPPLRGLRFRIDAGTLTNQILNGKNAMPAFKNIPAADLNALTDYLLWRDRPLPKADSKPVRPRYDFTGYNRFYDTEGYPANKPPWGTLNCLDLNTGRLLWKVALGEYPKLAAEGLPHTGTENYGGPIVTAGGLIFCSGTRDNKIRAFDKNNGRELWSAELPFTGSAQPATYEVNGRQYVVIGATGIKLDRKLGDAYVAFALRR
jgi:quinoprotein glucose dehydrogenase